MLYAFENAFITFYRWHLREIFYTSYATDGAYGIEFANAFINIIFYRWHLIYSIYYILQVAIVSIVEAIYLQNNPHERGPHMNVLR